MFQLAHVQNRHCRAQATAPPTQGFQGSWEKRLRGKSNHRCTLRVHFGGLHASPPSDADQCAQTPAMHSAMCVILAQACLVILGQCAGCAGHGRERIAFVRGAVAASAPQPPPGHDARCRRSGSAWGCGWLHLRGGAGSTLDMESAAGSGSSGSFGVVEPDWLRDIKEKQARGETPSLEAESSWNAPGTHSQKYPL